MIDSIMLGFDLLSSPQNIALVELKHLLPIRSHLSLMKLAVSLLELLLLLFKIMGLNGSVGACA